MENKFKRIKYITDLDEMNKILERSKRYTYRSFEEPKCYTIEHWIENKSRWFNVTTKYGYAPEKIEVCTYVYDKQEVFDTVVNPSVTYRALNQAGKIRDIVKEMPELFRIVEEIDEEGNKVNKIKNSAKAIIDSLDFRKEQGFEGYVYGYDLNSAYSSVLLEKVPDTFNMRLNDVVGENEVGFLLDDCLSLVRKGYKANVVFPLIESPYKNFIMKYYNKKKKAKTEDEKKIAKAYLNYPIGFAQNHNPFFRAFVVNKCSLKIQRIIEKHIDSVVYWNTDSIYSMVPLDDELTIGDDIGEWKLEYEGLFRLKGLNYQKVDKDNETTFRGLPKEIFDKQFNILTDKPPKYTSKVFYDEETNKLIRRGN